MKAAVRWLTADVRRLLAAAVLLTTVVVVGVGHLTAEEPTVPDAGVPVTRTPEPAVTITAPPEPTPAAPSDERGPNEVTRLYLEAFFDQDSTNAQWRARSARYSTPTLADLNAGVPRAVVPAIDWEGIKTLGVKDDYAEIRADMSDGYVLHVAVVKIDGRWLVDEVAPE